MLRLLFSLISNLFSKKVTVIVINGDLNHFSNISDSNINNDGSDVKQNCIHKNHKGT